MDREKMRLLQGKEPSDEMVDLYFSFLSDEKLMATVGGQFLAVYETVEDPKYKYKYKDLYEARKKFITSVANKYEKELEEIYENYSNRTTQGTYMQRQVSDIKNRQVKNICLGVLNRLDNVKIHKLTKKQFDEATSATDKISAFSNYLNSNAQDKLELLDHYQHEAKKHLVSWETFLAVVAMNDSEDAIDIMKKIEKSPDFRLEQTNDQRALYVRFAHNKKKSLQTQEGRQYLQESLIKMAPINEYVAIHLLEVLGNIDKLDTEYYIPLIQLLKDVQATLDKDKTHSVYNTINRILKGSPKAVKKFEKK